MSGKKLCLFVFTCLREFSKVPSHLKFIYLVFKIGFGLKVPKELEQTFDFLSGSTFHFSRVSPIFLTFVNYTNLLPKLAPELKICGVRP